MLSRTIRLALAAAMLLGLSGASSADDWRWRADGDHDRDDAYYSQEGREHNRFYEQGLRDGAYDREHHHSANIRHRNWDDNRDRDAYLAGYRAGYGSYQESWYGGYNPYGGNPTYGHNYPYGRNQAYNIGYQDGQRHGSQDRATGHSYRPTHDDDWRNADRGYNSSFGSKQAYKDEYRSGYQVGYDRGYRSRY
ncbi:MAG TPA: hypothetical protein VK473_06065 [Terriglobales bacterium]|nr:hypothetical protein [Terriglobales bacterium]